MRVSICIPQYNRAQYLLRALDSIKAQTHREIEVVVSDDCSSDESREIIPAKLREVGLDHQYIWQEKNLGYDRNLRASLQAATGDYLFIMGNDDMLADPDVIADVARELEWAGRPEVAMGNVPDWEDPKGIQRRCHFTGIAGAGPRTALRTFRSFTIVTGLIIRRDVFHRLDCDRFDKSVYVQVYLMAKAVADGARLLLLDRSVALLGLRLDGKHAESWVDTLTRREKRLQPFDSGLGSLARTAAAAFEEVGAPREVRKWAHSVFSQTLRYPYPFWLYQYRREGLALWAVNLALGCTPGKLRKGMPVGVVGAVTLWWDYLRSTVGGLLLPLPTLSFLHKQLHAAAKGI